MKLFVLVAAVVVSVLAAPDDFHDTLDDNFDFTPLTNDQLREVSMCLCGDGKCSDLTASYKKHYPEIIIEACRRCNPSQKHISRVFFDLLKEKLPEELKRCRDKHDPQGLYFDKYYDVIKNF